MARTVAKHPAPYSQEIIRILRELLLQRYPEIWGRPTLFDPCAGEGVGLAAIAGDEFNYAGLEIEPCFIIDPRIDEGDATEPDGYPKAQGEFVIVTSVVYANGVADHHQALDGSTRHTYRSAVGAIEGRDRELHPRNMGRYGYRGTKRPEDGGRSDKRAMYWALAQAMVPHWSKADAVFLNVSDFISHHTVVEPHVSDWVALLGLHGWSKFEYHEVATKRMKHGENRDTRVPYEIVIVATR